MITNYQKCSIKSTWLKRHLQLFRPMILHFIWEKNTKLSIAKKTAKCSAEFANLRQLKMVNPISWVNTEKSLMKYFAHKAHTKEPFRLKNKTTKASFRFLVTWKYEKVRGKKIFSGHTTCRVLDEIHTWQFFLHSFSTFSLKILIIS